MAITPTCHFQHSGLIGVCVHRFDRILHEVKDDLVYLPRVTLNKRQSSQFRECFDVMVFQLCTQRLEYLDNNLVHIDLLSGLISRQPKAPRCLQRFRAVAGVAAQQQKVR